MKLQVNSVVDSKLSLFCRISLKTEIVNSYSSVVEKVECGLEQGGDRHAAAGDRGHPGDGLQWPVLLGLGDGQSGEELVAGVDTGHWTTFADLW